MDHFVFRNPTKLLFGKGQIQALPKEVSRYGKKVLLVYGGGSIKRNGQLTVLNLLQTKQWLSVQSMVCSRS